MSHAALLSPVDLIRQVVSVQHNTLHQHAVMLVASVLYHFGLVPSTQQPFILIMRPVAEEIVVSLMA